jgi:F-type H+-transporting ATPase subunit b
MKRLALAAFLLAAPLALLHAQENPEGAAHAEEAGDPWIAWKWANFIILGAGLGYLIAKHMPVFFQSRTESIQKGIAEAQQMKREAEKRAAEMDLRVSALGAEVEKFQKHAAAEMEQEGARIREETSQQIAKLQRQAEQEIESAGKNARRELKKYAGELALNLAEQRIRAKLDATAENGLVEGFIDDLKRQQPGSRN